MSTPASKKYSDYTFRHVARVVIEFTTPFHVGTGEGGFGANALVVSDVNGLPTIPGSSLAGALRAALTADGIHDARTNDLFGFQIKDQGCGARLSLTWAAIHNRNDQPIQGLVAPACLEGDEVLQQALSLRIRDHVRLDHRGVADTANRGKFDEQPVAAGHRFTFELELISAELTDPDWTYLCRILSLPSLRLGGKSRRGYGAFRVVRISARSFELSRSDEFAAYASHPASLSQPAPALHDQTVVVTVAPRRMVTITLRLQPTGYWMFGGGDDLPPPGAAPADQAPLREDRIEWTNSSGRVMKDILLLPGSAIKGALSHRVAFHFNRLKSTFADELAAGCGNDDAGHEAAREKLQAVCGIYNAGVRELFGLVSESKDPASVSAARGRVLIDDLYWRAGWPKQQRVPHVSIDRFTGGAADSKLFSERPCWKGDFPDLRLVILEPDSVSPTTRAALKAALEDLTRGALALGAGAGRGLGYFEPRTGGEPTIECSDGGVWLNGKSPIPNPQLNAQP
ncbi:MAG TPA: RAMP superfamily CRISPR-associated protein [Verrucomicrobiota bacterium]|nr:hypothetical protein [Verrucomicrobiales bacterium]HRI14737.1 RAMP superfamily CRISPR-associated protein [Verrucomicrobiota bacterium]